MEQISSLLYCGLVFQSRLQREKLEGSLYVNMRNLRVSFYRIMRHQSMRSCDRVTTEPQTQSCFLNVSRLEVDFHNKPLHRQP